MNDSEQIKAINKLIGCIEESGRFVRKTIQLHHLHALFLIYMNEGITRKEIHNLIGNFSYTQTKQHIADLKKLSLHHKGKRPLGFDLIHEIEDERDAKLKHLYLNENGKELCEMLALRVISEETK